MSAEPRHVPLPEVRDLIALGHPLPFRVLDGQGRLLLGKGQTLLSERQLDQTRRCQWCTPPPRTAERLVG